MLRAMRRVVVEFAAKYIRALAFLATDDPRG
jgi:hypothetical protein